MTRWRIRSGKLDEREKDYTGEFHCLNLDEGRTVTITLTQNREEPAEDLVGACRALALLLERASRGNPLFDEEAPARLH